MTMETPGMRTSLGRVRGLGSARSGATHPTQRYIGSLR